MNKFIEIILILICLTSCNEYKKTETEIENKTNIAQFELAEPDSVKTELIIQKILDLPKLQWIYHSENKKRLPVKVLETEFIKKTFNLYKFGHKVRISSQNEFENDGIKDYIVFEKLEIKEETTEFLLFYKIEGVHCRGKLLNNSGKLRVLQYSVFEN